MASLPGTTHFPLALQGLLSPAAYAHPTERVELIETHISWVLLTGQYAYKIKRPVRYPFVDLSTVERRAFLCREELRLNRRFAPQLYLEVCDVRQREQQAFMGGAGEFLEQAVRMRQFDRHEELDRLLEQGALRPEEFESFGRSLARIHAHLPSASAASRWGAADQVQALLARNAQECQLALGEPRAGEADFPALKACHDERARQLAPVITDRQAGGHVRECHGDLHARNLIRHGGALLAFDCLEFEPSFRWIDVAQDVAFLSMDLRARGAPRHARQFLNGYLAQGGDFQALRVLDLYAAHCALVRAKVAALDSSPPETVQCYLAAAQAALSPRRRILVLMCGLSGSGKTWVAARLAPLLDAVHLRSDVERRRLGGIEEHSPSHSGIGGGLYSTAATTRLYEHLATAAGHGLAGGQSVIVDATFGRRTDRAGLRRLAQQLQAEIVVLYCRAPADTLRARILARQAQGTDASEADCAVLAWQQQRFDAPDAGEGLRVIDVDNAAASADVAEQLARELSGGAGRRG